MIFYLYLSITKAAFRSYPYTWEREDKANLVNYKYLLYFEFFDNWASFIIWSNKL